jgi:hypothetical protein
MIMNNDTQLFVTTQAYTALDVHPRTLPLRFDLEENLVRVSLLSLGLPSSTPGISCRGLWTLCSRLQRSSRNLVTTSRRCAFKPPRPLAPTLLMQAPFDRVTSRNPVLFSDLPAVASELDAWPFVKGRVHSNGYSGTHSPALDCL